MIAINDEMEGAFVFMLLFISSKDFVTQIVPVFALEMCFLLTSYEVCELFAIFSFFLILPLTVVVHFNPCVYINLTPLLDH